MTGLSSHHSSRRYRQPNAQPGRLIPPVGRLPTNGTAEGRAQRLDRNGKLGWTPAGSPSYADRTSAELQRSVTAATPRGLTLSIGSEMNKYVKIIGVAILATVMCGCASFGTDITADERAQIIKGKTTKIEVLRQFGNPDQTIKLDRGREEISYIKENVIMGVAPFVKPKKTSFGFKSRTASSRTLVREKPKNPQIT